VTGTADGRSEQLAVSRGLRQSRLTGVPSRLQAPAGRSWMNTDIGGPPQVGSYSLGAANFGPWETRTRECIRIVTSRRRRAESDRHGYVTGGLPRRSWEALMGGATSVLATKFHNRWERNQ